MLVLMLLAAHTPAQANDDALLKIVADTQHGRIEICHDPRWPAWRFDEGEAGRARLNGLKQLADAERKRREANRTEAPFEAARELIRLSALSAMVDAANAAADRQAWTATFDEVAAFIGTWRAKAYAIVGNEFPALVARRAVWRLARARTFAHQPPSETFRGIGRCLIGANRAVVEEAVVRRTLAILQRGWPSDARNGRGAEAAAIDIVDAPAGLQYITTNWARLLEGAKRERLPVGVLPLWRMSLDTDPESISTIEQYEARFETEWPQVAALVSGMSPATSIGEELFRRTRVEQYARHAMVIAYRQFGNDSASKGLPAVWKKVAEEDAANTHRMKELLASHTWFDDEIDGEGAENFGWLIVQHADRDPAFQRDVLNRLEPLLAQGRVRTQDYALLWDRVAVADKRLQRYGTQVTCEKGKGAWTPLNGIEDPDHLDDRRKQMGLRPWKEYVVGFGPCR
jgi:hypothetical protein